MKKPDVFKRYPQLANLRGKVPDEVVRREMEEKAPRFERSAARARRLIPMARMVDLFPPELERGRIVLENFLGQWGNISVEEVCKIALIAAWLKPRKVFEFGTFNGMCTLQMALNTPARTRIYTLDIPPELTATLEGSEIDQHLARKAGAFRFQVGHYFKRSKHARKITQLWGDSATMDFSAYNRQMDLVFVDASHSYPYVKSDTANAFRMLKPGGVILWHNYMDVFCPDVTRHLSELAAAGRKIHHLRGTVLGVYHDPK